MANLMTSTAMQLEKIIRMLFNPLPSQTCKPCPYNWLLDVEIAIIISWLVVVSDGV